MKVLMVITTSYVSYGGLTTVAMNYFRNINRDAFEIDFASINDCSKSFDKELRDSGSRYYKLPHRTKSPISYMRVLYKVCRDYDVIHVHGNSATTVLELLPAKLTGVKKRIIHIHNTKSEHTILHSLLSPLMKYLMTDAVACSDAAGKWIFTDSNFKVLNNAIDLTKYSYSNELRFHMREKYRIDENMLAIGHVGKFVEQKNHMFLIDIFKKIVQKNSRVKLMLVGDGGMRNKIEEKIKTEGLESQVILCGIQDNISRFLSVMDIIVFPSLWKGLPLSLLESQANGLPCVASDVITSEVNMGGAMDFFIKGCLFMG